MQSTPIHKSEAFTLLELTVVIFVVFVVVLFVMSQTHPVHSKAQRISCINNLKQIGTAYRIWANDNVGLFPAEQSVGKGGWREILTNANQGFLCWTNYVLMSNELGESPKILICPSDQRQPADIFTNFSNTNLSYFVGVSSDDNYPQSILSGDRNLAPGTAPSNDYGFSSKTGLGNDVAIQTNSKSDPICWSLKIHSYDPKGVGNILLGDGSAQQVTSGNFRANWQPNGGLTTNWPGGHVPWSPSFRVLFP